MAVALGNILNQGRGTLYRHQAVGDGVLKGIQLVRNLTLLHGSSTLPYKEGDVFETSRDFYATQNTPEGRAVAASHAPPNLSSASGCSDASGNGDEMCSGGSCDSARVFEVEVLNPELAKEIEKKNEEVVKIPKGEHLKIVAAKPVSSEEKAASLWLTAKLWGSGLGGLTLLGKAIDLFS